MSDLYIVFAEKKFYDYDIVYSRYSTTGFHIFLSEEDAKLYYKGCDISGILKKMIYNKESKQYHYVDKQFDNIN